MSSDSSVQTIVLLTPGHRGRHSIQTDPVQTTQLLSSSGRHATSNNVSLLQGPSQPVATMAMFKECSNVTISGGTFTMVQPNEPQDDFRTIRVGDINLLSLVKEDDILENHVVLHQKNPGRVHRQTVCVATRKTYHAKIFGSQDVFTVMAYEGNLAEWMRKSAGEAPRHPNHIQLFGITDSVRMHAVVYHDELIPAFEAVQQCPSRLSRKLLHYILSIHLQSVRHYLQDTYRQVLYDRAEWFSVSTGRLRVEMDHRDYSSWLPLYSNHLEMGPSLFTLQVIHPLQGQISDKMLLAKIALRDLLHILCYRSAPSQAISITPYHGLVQLATVYTVEEPWSPSGKFVGSLRKTRKTCALPSSSDFVYSNSFLISSGRWQRFLYNEVVSELGSGLHDIWTEGRLKDRENIFESWLAHINTVELPASGTFMADAPTTTDLYLFILVPEPYTVGNRVWVDIPPGRGASFWSLDAIGNQQLSDEDCLRLGLPKYTLHAAMTGMIFHEEDYKLIRNFRAIHSADPEMFEDVQSGVTWHDGSLLVDSLQIDESRGAADFCFY
ncbi:hypothetical protein C8F01DRAFT_1230658 [Mycena amicta]|nr:hypothetical protein C8F01DRAFT_1230658 [Mycena amicta]